MDDAAAAKARRQAMATIEKESFDRTGLRSDVVTLYRGGRYHLYTYKKYTDVRLVFAPEHAIAFFGGDPDNFEFPRYDLDVAFFRAYEDGKPAKPAHYLPWGEGGTKEGDLVFVVGNPGSTSRLNTVAHLEYLRDVVAAADPGVAPGSRGVPHGIRPARGRGDAAGEAGSLRYPEQPEGPARPTRRPARSRPDRSARRKRSEPSAGGSRPTRPGTRPTGRPGTRSPARSTPPGGSAGRRCSSRAARPSTPVCSTIARTIVRLVEEDAKPNAERLREYGDAGRASLERALYSPAPIYPEFEEAKLARSLAFWRRTMGESDPTVARVLDGRTPEEAARDAGAAAPDWPTSPSARGWSREAGRRSRPRMTR